MIRPAPTDALAGIGIGLVFVGAWTVWPSLAIIIAGVALLGVAVLLAYLRRDRAAEEHHEG